MSSWTRSAGLFLSGLFSFDCCVPAQRFPSRFLSALLLSALSLLAAPVHAASSLEQDFYHGLLLHPEADQLRFGAKAVASTKESDPEVLDVVAQRLWEEAPKVNERTRDAVSWLARVLGESRQARYRELLGAVQTRSADRKLQRHVQEAMRQMSPAAIEQFVPDSVDLQALREQVLARQQAERERIGRPDLQGLKPGAGLHEVLAAWGPPDAVDTTRATVDVPGPFPTLYQYTVQLMYFGTGAVRLDDKHQWRLLHTVHSLQQTSQRYEGSDALVAHNLMLPGNDALRIQLIQLAKHRKQFEPALLEVMAARLWLGRNAISSQEADAMAYLVRFLSVHGQGRYRHLLQTLASTSTSGKIRDYAEDYLDEHPATQAEQWQPPVSAEPAPVSPAAPASTP